MRRSTLVALAAALLVLGWILLFERGEPDSEAEGTPVFDVAADEVLAASIARPDAPTVRLTRADGGWVVAEGEGPPVPADASEVDLLLQNIESLRSERELPAGDDLARFGLAPPGLSVEIEAAEGAQQVGFGQETPAPGNRYLRSGDAVLVVPAFARDNFDRAAWDFRDKRLFRLDSPAARRLSLGSDGETVELAREDGVWRILQPFRFLADPFEAATLADQVLDARMLGPRSEDPDSDAGFGAPRLTAELDLVTGTEETPTSVTLRFGDRSDSPPGVFVRAGEGDVAVVADALFDDLEAAVRDGLAGVRSLRVFRFAAFRALEVRIEAPGEALAFLRSDGEERREWTLEEETADPVTVDGTAVDDFLYALNSTDAEAVADAGLPSEGDRWTLTVTEAEDGGAATSETVRLTVRSSGPVHALREDDARALVVARERWTELNALLATARAPATDP